MPSSRSFARRLRNMFRLGPQRMWPAGRQEAANGVWHRLRQWFRPSRGTPEHSPVSNPAPPLEFTSGADSDDSRASASPPPPSAPPEPDDANPPPPIDAPIEQPPSSPAESPSTDGIADPPAGPTPSTHEEDSPPPEPAVDSRIAATTPPAEHAPFGTPEDFSDAYQVHQTELQTYLRKARASLERPARQPQRRSPPTPKPNEPALPPLESRAEQLAELFAQLKTPIPFHMTFLVLYDIENNRVRTHLAQYLQEMGLRRIQKSVFLGRQDRRTYNDMYEAVKAIQESYDNNDSVIFMPVGEDDLFKLKLVGQAIDLEFVLYDRHTWVF